MKDTITGAPPPLRARPVGSARQPLHRGFALSLALLAGFAAYTWLVVAWPPFVALDDALNRNFHVHALWPVLHLTDRVGQRAVCLPVLAAVACWVAWRRRTWRPLAVGAAAVVLVNLLVGLAKIALSRGAPLSGESFFSGGDQYPSGHTSNVMVVYGFAYYLLLGYGSPSPRVRRGLRRLAALLPAAMFAASLLLRWHWFSDLVGGFVLGGAVLALAVGVDVALLSRADRVPAQPAAAPSHVRRLTASAA